MRTLRKQQPPAQANQPQAPAPDSMAGLGALVQLISVLHGMGNQDQELALRQDENTRQGDYQKNTIDYQNRQLGLTEAAQAQQQRELDFRKGQAGEENAFRARSLDQTIKENEAQRQQGERNNQRQLGLGALELFQRGQPSIYNPTPNPFNPGVIGQFIEQQIPGLSGVLQAMQQQQQPNMRIMERGLPTDAVMAARQKLGK